MTSTLRTLTALAAALGTVACAAAQSPAPPVPAPASGGAESITAADVSRRVHLIAHDSMGGRGTPSPGLETMAAYVSAEFRRLGLTPGGDSNSYIQRYPIEVYASRPESSSVWATGRAPGRWGLGQEFKFGQGTIMSDHIAAGAVLWTGTPQPGAALDPASVAEGRDRRSGPG